MYKDLESVLIIAPYNEGQVAFKVTNFIDIESSMTVVTSGSTEIDASIKVPYTNEGYAVFTVTPPVTDISTLTPIKDAMIRQNLPINYGNEQEMLVGNVNNELFRALLSFDLGSIPVGREIIRAVLKLYHANSLLPDVDIALEQLSGDWTERGVLWYTQPGTDGVITTVKAGNKRGYIEIDLLEMIDHWYHNPSTNNGMLLRYLSESLLGTRKFYTRESKSPPLLEVEYSLSEVRTPGRVDVNSSIVVSAIKSLTLECAVEVIPVIHYLESECIIKVSYNNPLDILSQVYVKHEHTLEIDCSVNPATSLFKDLDCCFQVKFTKDLVSDIVVKHQHALDADVNLVVRGFASEQLDCNIFVANGVKYIPCDITVREMDDLSFDSEVVVQHSHSRDIDSDITVRVFKDVYTELTVRAVRESVVESEVTVKHSDMLEVDTEIIIRSPKDIAVPSSLLVYHSHSIPLESDLTVQHLHKMDMESSMFVYNGIKQVLSELIVRAPGSLFADLHVTVQHSHSSDVDSEVIVQHSHQVDYDSVITSRAIQNLSIDSGITIQHSHSFDVESSIQVRLFKVIPCEIICRAIKSSMVDLQITVQHSHQTDIESTVQARLFKDISCELVVRGINDIEVQSSLVVQHQHSMESDLQLTVQHFHNVEQDSSVISRAMCKLEANCELLSKNFIDLTTEFLAKNTSQMALELVVQHAHKRDLLLSFLAKNHVSMNWSIDTKEKSFLEMICTFHIGKKYRDLECSFFVRNSKFILYLNTIGPILEAVVPSPIKRGNLITVNVSSNVPLDNWFVAYLVDSSGKTHQMQNVSFPSETTMFTSIDTRRLSSGVGRIYITLRDKVLNETTLIKEFILIKNKGGSTVNIV